MKRSRSSISSLTQVRLARPTAQLDEIIQFYCQGLGFNSLLEFDWDQAGYAGVVLSIPGTDIYLEFVTHQKGFSKDEINPPTEDHLLVFYLEHKSDYEATKHRLVEMGYYPVKAKNQHWDLAGSTFEDPDGWRVVLMLGSNI